MFILIAGVDYTPIQETVVFDGSNSRLCVNIAIFANGSSEDAESFFVVLQTVDSRVQVKQSWTRVTIIDSDS